MKHMCLALSSLLLASCASSEDARIEHRAPASVSMAEGAAAESCVPDPDFGDFPEQPSVRAVAGTPHEDHLTEDFVFIDSRGRQWTAPESQSNDLWRWNGSSIPWVFGAAFGTPKVGCHRLASIHHDYLYQRAEDHQLTRKQVDQLYYEGLRANGVGKYRAKSMYFALRLGGSSSFQRAGAVEASFETLSDEEQLAALEAVTVKIEQEDLTLEEIDSLAADPMALTGF